MNNKVYKTIIRSVLGLQLTVGLIFSGSKAFAQEPVHPSTCGNNIYEMAKQHPEFWKELQTFDGNYKLYKDQLNLRSFEQTTSGKYIIPVVIHVLHLGGGENSSANSLKSMINILNNDFKMQNSGISGLSGFDAFDTLVPYFNGVDTTYVIYGNDTIDMLNRIEFRLATLDPLGNCTDGINRVYTLKAENAGDNTKFKSVSYWDRAKYYNIWVVKDFPSANLLGYSQFPFAFGGQFPVTSTDGTTIRYTTVGGGTLTHESGHWLGLRHIWGDADCGSDGIDDTPLHLQENFSGPGCFPLPKTATCYSDTATTDSVLNALNFIRRDSIGEMWMNFMDYTDDNCTWMFSELQYQLMNVVMKTISFRTNLSTTTNIAATGTDDAAQATKCAAPPIADFWSRDGSNYYIIKKMICAGGDLTYRDGTYNLSNPNSNAATLAYDFPGGTPASSTSANPVIVYDTPGEYDATLTSTNTEGVSTKTRSDFVYVSSNTADESNVIYYEDFEYGTSLFEQGKWVIINEGLNPQNKWEQFTGAGYQSSKCMVMRNDDNIIYEPDFLITASYDLTTISNDKLLFRYSGARKTNNPYLTQNDKLRIYTSTNCGENWTVRTMKVDGVNKGYLSGDTLYCAGLHTNGFVPSDPSHWKQAEVDLATVGSSSNVRIMFAWESAGGYGNDFYIDQVQIVNGNSIGIEEVISENDYRVYPNPVSSTSQVYVNLHETSDVTIDVLDLTGRLIKVIYSGNLESGESYFELHKEDVSAAGVYMVRLNVNGITTVKKVIIE